jgi:hypothetical protein
MEYYHIHLLHVYFHTFTYYMSISIHPTITSVMVGSVLLIFLVFYVYVLFLCLRIKTMFGSSLLPVVGKRAHVLFTLFVFVCV